MKIFGMLFIRFQIFKPFLIGLNFVLKHVACFSVHD